MNKRKILVGIAVVLLVVPAFAHRCCRPRPRPPCRPHGCYHHHRPPTAAQAWTAAGIGIAAGVAGRLVDWALTPDPPKPVVVQQQVVVQQPVAVQKPVRTAPKRVWVDGRYVDQVQPNGSVVQVWQPGHYR